MMRHRGQRPNADKGHEFRQHLQKSLTKLSGKFTNQAGWEEINILIFEHITDIERINTFLYMVSQKYHHEKVLLKKDYTKLLSLAGELFEDALIPQITNRSEYANKRFEESDDHLDEICSESILKMIFTNIINPNKETQISAGVCLSKIIQNAPIESLIAELDTISERMIDLLASNTCKCHTQVLEALISLILAIEDNFEPYAVNFLPYLLECMAMNDWATRKMAIDVIYTLAAILSEVLIPFKAEILEVLNHSRFDKFKPVREATIEAVQIIKNLGKGEDMVQEPERVTSKTPKSRPGLRDTIKQAKKDHAKKSKAQTLEMLDKSNNDRKISTATQKRIESKKEAIRTKEEKKDAGPISYDDVKSHIFKGPKNNNFFKTKKKKEEEEIQIFAKGDHKDFDYEKDMKQHQEQDSNARKTQAKTEDFNVQIFESKHKQQNPNDSEVLRERNSNEDSKVSKNQRAANSSNNIKEPEEVPIHIYVKGKPMNYKNEEPSPQLNDSGPKQSYRDIDEKPQSEMRREHFDENEKIGIDGDEYEASMNLLKEHQRMMSNQNSKNDQNKNDQRHAFEMPQRVDNQREQYPRQQYKSNQSYNNFAPQAQQQFNMQNFAQTPSYPQYHQPQVSQNDLLLQKRIEQFTQQMTSSMSNLQNFVRSEMNGVKQRMSYLESKVETIIRRQNEFDLDRLNHSNFKNNIGPSEAIPQANNNFIDNFSVANFEKDMFQAQNFSLDEKSKQIDTLDDWTSILELVQQDKVDTAYQNVLSKQDDMLLFKLMGRTGVCIDKLDSSNLEKLLRTVALTLSSKAFIDLLLPWVSQYCNQFSNLPPDAKKPLMMKSIQNCLHVLMTDTQHYLDSGQKESVEKMHEFIRSKQSA